MIPRSSSQVVHSVIDVKNWAERVPAVGAVRPARCPCCARAGRPLGSALGIVGHGFRARQVRGPGWVGRPPELREVRARRYRCRGCKAILVVVPRGVLARRHFSAGAIALALLRYGVGVRVIDIRRELGGSGETAAWPTLRRWVVAANRMDLWSSIRGSPPDWTARQVAHRAAMTLIAHAPPGGAYGSAEERVFVGAAHAA